MPNQENEETIRPLVLQAPEEARGLLIADDASYSSAGGFLTKLKTMKERVHTIFDPIVKAAYAAHKAATGRRSELLAPIEEADKIVRSELGRYKAEKDRLAAEAAKALALGDGENELDAAMALAVADGAPKVAGLSYRKVWRFEVTDENAVPRAYLVPNEEKIWKAIHALGGEAGIPGVRVWSEDVPVAR